MQEHGLDCLADLDVFSLSGRSFFRMLRDIIAALLPLAGSVSYNSPRLAELVLLVLISFSVGFCCGGILVCFLVSAHCRAGVSRLLLAFLEGQLPDPRLAPRGGRDRLEAYRA